MDLVPKNAAGFHSFPEYFRGYRELSEFEVEHAHTYHPATTDELDGTGAIVIALALLWQRLPEANAVRGRIHEFLHQPASPLRYLHLQLEERPLLVGRGEFGGSITGVDAFCNVVQNYLGALAFAAAASMEIGAGDAATAGVWREDSRRIQDGMLRYLVDAEGCWLWCVDPRTLKPDQSLLDTPQIKGMGGINGVASMYADALGLLPGDSGWEGIEVCRKTFDRLLSHPMRKEQFEKHGLWTMVDDPKAGLGTSLSYASGYALQTMLLYDRLDMAEKVIHWLADATYHAEQQGVLFTNFPTGRMSPWYFYERYFSPDAAGTLEMNAGCGPLNLVNVAEPLKAARLILGVDDTSIEEVRLVPRLPPSWKGMEATDWPVLTSAGTMRADIRVERRDGALSIDLKVHGEAELPKLAVRFPRGTGFEWRRESRVRRLAM
jgi:hypothetical protein